MMMFLIFPFLFLFYSYFYSACAHSYVNSQRWRSEVLIIPIPYFKFFRCGHVLKISVLLFRKSCSEFMPCRIRNFSVVHNEHSFDPFTYGFDWSSIFHYILNCFSCFLYSHTLLDSTVTFLLFSCLKDVKWL